MVIPALLTAAAVGGALWGKNKQVPQQTGASGLAAAPAPLAHAYLTGIVPEAWQQFAGGKFKSLPMGMAPTGPFASKGLQELQNYSNQVGGLFDGTNGVNPLGQVEPLNSVQQRALGSFAASPTTYFQDIGNYMNPYQQAVLNQLAGGGKALQEDVTNYMKPYLEQVLGPTLRQINDVYDEDLSSLKGMSARAGLGAQDSSAFGTQQALLQKFKNRAIQDATDKAVSDSYNQALGQRNLTLSGLFQGGGQAFGAANDVKRQTLQDMLNAGTAIQQQGQSYLNALQPQLQQTLPANRLGLFGQQLNMIPGSTTSTGYVSEPNAWAKIGGLGLAGLGLMAPGGGNMASLMNGGNAMNTLGGGGGNVGTYLQQPAVRTGYSLF